MGTSPGEPSAPPPPDQSFTGKMLSQAQGRFDAVEKVFAQAQRTRKGLDALVGKGDSVTEDDVLDEMATLVAHGADPKNLAAVIAGDTQAGVGPMPPGGEPLAGWLRDAEAKLFAPAETALKSAMALAQHQLGVAAVHRMVEVHATATQRAQAPQSPSPALGAPPPQGGFASSPQSPLLH